MKYGIWVVKQIFDVFDDGSKRRLDIIEGWHKDEGYESMKAAKESLADVEEMLNEDWYDVTKVNTVTLKGVRVNRYGGEPFAPVMREEYVVYHIKKLNII